MPPPLSPPLPAPTNVWTFNLKQQKRGKTKQSKTSKTSRAAEGWTNCTCTLQPFFSSNGFRLPVLAKQVWLRHVAKLTQFSTIHIEDSDSKLQKAFNITPSSAVSLGPWRIPSQGKNAGQRRDDAIDYGDLTLWIPGIGRPRQINFRTGNQNLMIVQGVVNGTILLQCI